jgi:IclR family acetate operon transcriptional repressor
MSTRTEPGDQASRGRPRKKRDADDPAGANEPSYPIRSVDRALELLLLFGSRNQLSVSEAAKLLGVAPSTAHRMLAMLQQRNFVRQDERSKLYVAGPALVQAGLAAIHQLDIREELRPYMASIVTQVGETAHLQIRQGRYVLFFDGIECQHALRAAQRTGTLLPAHCTAGGKALLAQLSDDEIDRLYDGHTLEQETTESVSTLAKLKEELVRTRERGWASNDGESEGGLCAVAAAIPRGDRLIMPAAITVAGPSFRMNDRQRAGIGEVLVNTVTRIATGSA